MAITIKDVAALAGVSPSTVSRTCKDHPAISEQTKKKVRAAMEQLGYEPSVQAGVLAGQSGRMIGIILPPSEQETYQNVFFLEAIRGISQYCNQKHYMNTLITGADEAEILSAVQTMVRNGMAEGFIVLYSKEEDPVTEYLYGEGLLYALIGKAYRNANQTIYVDNDNVLAAREAAGYLIGLGHERIAFLSGNSSLLVHGDRKAGYLLSLAEHRIPFREEFYVEVPHVQDGNLDMIDGLLEREDRPTAVLVSDDILAIALEKACISRGLSIPEDISVISFNNSLLARFTTPPLTCVDINPCQLGWEAAAQMVSHMENPELVATKIIVPHHMEERGSCVRRD